MTAHIISQGTQPSLHPGVLRNIGSIIRIQAPVPATAREVLARLTPNRGQISEMRTRIDSSFIVEPRQWR